MTLAKEINTVNKIQRPVVNYSFLNIIMCLGAYAFVLVIFLLCIVVGEKKEENYKTKKYIN